MKCVISKGRGYKLQGGEATLQSVAWVMQATLATVLIPGQGLMPKWTALPRVKCDKQEGFSPAWTLVRVS